MERLLRNLTRTGMRRGVLGGSRSWAIVWLAAFAIRKWGIRREEVVYSESLEPGGRLTIVHEELPGKDKGRRAGRRR
ncbi:MAG TPA: hypothetical protein VGF64_06875 [Acidimicrobiales bacterium]|jgi:hypothetical protein